jgi:hypothetical protein
MKIFHFETEFLRVEVQPKFSGWSPTLLVDIYITFMEVCGYWFFQIGTVLLKCQFPVKSGMDIVLTVEE